MSEESDLFRRNMATQKQNMALQEENVQLQKRVDTLREVIHHLT